MRLSSLVAAFVAAFDCRLDFARKMNNQKFRDGRMHSAIQDGQDAEGCPAQRGIRGDRLGFGIEKLRTQRNLKRAARYPAYRDPGQRGGDCAGDWGCKRRPGSPASWPQMAFAAHNIWRNFCSVTQIPYHTYSRPRIDWPVRELLGEANISDN